MGNRREGCVARDVLVSQGGRPRHTTVKAQEDVKMEPRLAGLKEIHNRLKFGDGGKMVREILLRLGE